MTSKPSSKAFDCVQNMRQIRDKLSAEIGEMSYDELTQWLREHRYSDPSLQQLAEKAAQQADAADRRGLRNVVGTSPSKAIA